MENNNEKKLPYVAAKIDRVMDNSNSLKAFATITIANSFMVHNIRVVEGSKGLFVAMPNRSYQNDNGNTKYSDICHAISNDMKQRIDSVVLNAYQMAIGQNMDSENEVSDVVNEPDTMPFSEATEDEDLDYDFVPSM